MAVHPTAIIDPQAHVDSTCEIGPRVVIDGPVTIGPYCRIAPSAVILGHTTIGAHCAIHSHAVVGDVPQDHRFHGQETYLEIGDHCVIREGVTIHRAVLEQETTSIGDHCYLMTNSHVGHDCTLGDHVTLVSGALLGGHVTIGDHAIISGNAAVHQFVRVGELAMVSGLAKVVQDVPPFLMTDREGSIVGLNRVGLRRAGFSVLERQELKTLFKLVYRTGMSYQQVCDLAKDVATTESGHRFLDFFNTNSSRGIRKSAQRNRAA